MEIWVLTALENDQWEDVNPKPGRVVVRANDEKEARELAAESRGFLYQATTSPYHSGGTPPGQRENRIPAWKDQKAARCENISVAEDPIIAIEMLGTRLRRLR